MAKVAKVALVIAAVLYMTTGQRTGPQPIAPPFHCQFAAARPIPNSPKGDRRFAEYAKAMYGDNYQVPDDILARAAALEESPTT